MAAKPTQDSGQTVWKINNQHASIWRYWDGEMVLYDDFSGDTMKLDVIMTAAFQFLLRAPATRDQLTDHLAWVFELEQEPRLWSLTTRALEKFEQTGLIEPTCEVAPPVGLS